MNSSIPYFTLPAAFATTANPFICSSKGMCFGTADYRDAETIVLTAAALALFLLVSAVWTVWSILGALRFTWRERLMFLAFLYFLPEIMAYRIVKMPVVRHFWEF